MPHDMGLANPKVPLSDWFRIAVSERSWSESAAGVFESADRFHVLKNRVYRDGRATVVTTAGRYRSQLVGYQTAARNINDAITLLSLFDTSLAVIDAKLESMKKLATEATDASMTDSDRSIRDVTYSDLATELDVVATASEYMGIDLHTGSPAALRFQASIRGVGTHQIVLSLPDLTFNGLFNSSSTIATLPSATTALSNINTGLDRTQSSAAEAEVVRRGLIGGGTFTGRVIAFMIEKLESIADKPLDKKDVKLVIAKLLDEGYRAILAQEPDELGKAKGDINVLDLLEERLPLDARLYSLNPVHDFSARTDKPFVNINGSAVTPRKKAPFFNLPTTSKP